MNFIINKYEDDLLSLPGPEALCLCAVEEAGRSLVCPCGPCWAPGPGAAAGADPGLPHPTEEDEELADSGGGHLHSGGGLVCVGL